MKKSSSQLVIAPIENARVIVLHPLPQDQILSPRRRPDRVRLHESHTVQRVLQRRRRKQAARHRIRAENIERNRHHGILSK